MDTVASVLLGATGAVVTPLELDAARRALTVLCNMNMEWADATFVAEAVGPVPRTLRAGNIKAVLTRLDACVARRVIDRRTEVFSTTYTRTGNAALRVIEAERARLTETIGPLRAGEAWPDYEVRVQIVCMSRDRDMAHANWIIGRLRALQVLEAAAHDVASTQAMRVRPSGID